MADPEDFDFDKEFGDFEDMVGDFDDFADFAEFEGGDASGSVYESAGDEEEPSEPRTKIVVKQQYTEEEKEFYRELREKYKRALDLKDRVKLTESNYDLYAAPPKTAYELYARKTTHQTTSTGTDNDYAIDEKATKKKAEGGGLRQAAVQCPPAENFVAKKINTEMTYGIKSDIHDPLARNNKAKLHSSSRPAVGLKKKHVSCQVPEDMGLYTPAARHLFEHSSKSGVEARERHWKLNSESLTRFLTTALPVMESIIQENDQYNRMNEELAENTDSSTISTTTFNFSDHCQIIAHAILTMNRVVVDVKFGKNQDIVVCYGPLEEEKKYDSNVTLQEPGLICIWSTKKLTRNETLVPTKILVSESQLTSLCMMPDKTHFVIAGTVDGSIHLWDLRELNSYHVPIENSDGLTLVKRFPTYATDWLIHENHQSAVSQLLPIGYNEAHREVSKDSSQQLVSLEENGKLIFWVLVELSSQSIANNDYGLSMHGRVKLVKGGEKCVFQSSSSSSSTQHDTDMDFMFDESLNDLSDMTLDDTPTPQQHVSMDSLKRASCLDNDPMDRDKFLIGTDQGIVYRSHRFSAKIVPPHYFDAPSIDKRDSSMLWSDYLEMTVLAFNPLLTHILACGRSDGSILLFDSRYARPISTIVCPSNQRIISLLFSPSLPHILLALDSSSHLFFIDCLSLDASDKKKIFSHQSVARTNVSSQQSIPAVGLSMKRVVDSSQQHLCIAYSDGRVDVHHMKDDFYDKEIPDLLSFQRAMETLFVTS